MAHDALAAHARDELGLSARSLARPLQAALASAGSFTIGALIPLLAALFAPPQHLISAIMIVSLARSWARRDGCQNRRRQPSGRRPAGDILERPGDGRHGRGRRGVRLAPLNPAQALASRDFAWLPTFTLHSLASWSAS